MTTTSMQVQGDTQTQIRLEVHHSLTLHSAQPPATEAKNLGTRPEPVEISFHRIREADDIRFAEACQVLADSFKGGSLMKSATGGDDKLHLMMRTAMARSTLINGELWAATTNDGKVVGTAAWHPPSAGKPDRTKETMKIFAPFFAELQKTTPAHFTWWTQVLLIKHSELSARYLGKDFKKHNWHLMSFGVDPNFQGRGIGKKLLQIGEQKAAELKLKTTLETDSISNVNMYQHLGYTIAGHECLPGAEGTSDGLEMYILVKAL